MAILLNVILIQDVYRELDQMICTVEDLERWRDRIYEVIHRGAYYVTALLPFMFLRGR